jgi:flagellar motility protein MotE (MotC chaperone)
MATTGDRRALGGVGLIVLCFLASGALRAIDSGAAIAEEIGAGGGGGEAEAADAEGLMQAIRAREAALDAEATRLADRQQTLNVAEAKLAEQLAAFETAQSQLEETLALADNAAERDIAQMTAVYESMKPADAARIFGRMDVGFASGLLSRLRPEVAAAILTGMEADAAYAITLTIASRNANVPTE